MIGMTGDCVQVFTAYCEAKLALARRALGASTRGAVDTEVDMDEAVLPYLTALSQPCLQRATDLLCNEVTACMCQLNVKAAGATDPGVQLAMVRSLVVLMWLAYAVVSELDTDAVKSTDFASPTAGDDRDSPQGRWYELAPAPSLGSKPSSSNPSPLQFSLSHSSSARGST